MLTSYSPIVTDSCYCIVSCINERWNCLQWYLSGRHAYLRLTCSINFSPKYNLNVASSSIWLSITIEQEISIWVRSLLGISGTAQLSKHITNQDLKDDMNLYCSFIPWVTISCCERRKHIIRPAIDCVRVWIYLLKVTSIFQAPLWWIQNHPRQVLQTKLVHCFLYVLSF